MSFSENLESAQEALSRGDYQQCLEKLETLSELYPPFSEERTKITLLMITALMGKGENKKAIDLCHSLTKHPDYSYKQQAKDLLTIIGAPILAKPKNWSVTIPKLDVKSTTKESHPRRQLFKRTSKPPPPTGSTKAFQGGFALLVTIIFLVLTIFLSGCVQFTTSLSIEGPDRLRVLGEIQSNSNQLLPWQKQFSNSLKSLSSKIDIQNNLEGKQSLRTSTISSKEANLLIKEIVQSATTSAGFDLASPEIEFKETNLLIGVKEHLRINIDLKRMPKLPGLKLSIHLSPTFSNKAPKGEPLPATVEGSKINWPLEQGFTNNLEVDYWLWSPLGIGIIVILIITTLTIIVQSLKIKLGFGFPELPP